MEPRVLIDILKKVPENFDRRRVISHNPPVAADSTILYQGMKIISLPRPMCGTKRTEKRPHCSAPG
jgi:hypothetical protein